MGCGSSNKIAEPKTKKSDNKNDKQIKRVEDFNLLP